MFDPTYMLYAVYSVENVINRVNFIKQCVNFIKQ